MDNRESVSWNNIHGWEDYISLSSNTLEHHGFSTHVPFRHCSDWDRDDVHIPADFHNTLGAVTDPSLSMAVKYANYIYNMQGLSQ